MTRTRQIAIAFAAGRGAFGAGLIASPARMAAGWIGGDAGRRPPQVAIRGLGARDVALAGGTVAAAAAGQPVRPWLMAAVACDLSDIAATYAAGDTLPARARIGTVALAGLSALAGAALTAAVEE
jgi:hypothetical protein